MTILTFLPYFLCAFFFSVILVPWVGKLAEKFDVIQYPPSKIIEKLTSESSTDTLKDFKLIAARRRLEKHPMAMWGGISYVVPFFILSIYGLLSSKSINIAPENFYQYLFWFISILILFIVGVIDDKYELSGKTQFIFHVLATLIFIASPLNFNSIRTYVFGDLSLAWFTWAFNIASVPLSFVFPSDLILFFWIILMIQAIKWQAGSDALMEGNVFIALITIFAVSIMFNQPESALFSVLFAGAILGFILYNFYPALIISGSSGKSVVGFFLATLSIVSNTKLAVSLVVFSIPIIDALWVLIRRILYYKPKSLGQLFSISDRFHLHHRLMELGFTEVQIALLEYTITLSMAAGVVLFTGVSKFIYLIACWILIAIVIVIVTKKSHEKVK